MKIGIVHLNLTYQGADSRIVFTLAQTLKRMGHWVVIYAGEYDPSCFPVLAKDLDIRAARTNTPLASVIGAYGFWDKLRERISKNLLHVGLVQRLAYAMEPDLHAVICHNDYSYQIANIYKKRNPEARMVWTMNNLPFHAYVLPRMRFSANWINRLNAFFERLRINLYRRSLDKVLVLDEKRRELAERSGLEVELLPVPVSFQQFYAPTRPLLTKEPIRMMSVGLLFPTRRFEDAILATAALNVAGYRVELDLICKDVWKNKEYSNFLRNLVHQHGLGNQVRFYFKGVEDGELKKLYRRSRIFLLLSTSKLWAMAAFEAMAAGNLLIACDVTTVAHVLKDKESMLQVEVGRPDEIADQVKYLIAHPSIYRKIAKAGQEYVKRNLDWTKYAENILEMAFEKETGKTKAPSLIR